MFASVPYRFRPRVRHESVRDAIRGSAASVRSRLVNSGASRPARESLSVIWYRRGAIIALQIRGGARPSAYAETRRSASTRPTSRAIGATEETAGSALGFLGHAEGRCDQKSPGSPVECECLRNRGGSTRRRGAGRNGTTRGTTPLVLIPRGVLATVGARASDPRRDAPASRAPDSTAELDRLIPNEVLGC